MKRHQETMIQRKPICRGLKGKWLSRVNGEEKGDSWRSLPPGNGSGPAISDRGYHWQAGGALEASVIGLPTDSKSILNHWRKGMPNESLNRNGLFTAPSDSSINSWIWNRFHNIFGVKIKCLQNKGILQQPFFLRGSTKVIKMLTLKWYIAGERVWRFREINRRKW